MILKLQTRSWKRSSEMWQRMPLDLSCLEIVLLREVYKNEVEKEGSH